MATKNTAAIDKPTIENYESVNRTIAYSTAGDPQVN